MKFLFFCTFIFALSLAAVGTAKTSNISTPQTGVLPALNIGQPLPEFSLPDLAGKTQSLASLKGKKGLLLVFISSKCPCSHAYNERMEKIAQDYKARGVSFVGLSANANELSKDVKRYAATNRLTFPILRDEGNKLADKLGAQITPEAFLFDESNKLVYHGRIDNSKDPAQVKTQDLRDALDASLAGKPVEKPVLKALGCAIQRVK